MYYKYFFPAVYLANSVQTKDNQFTIVENMQILEFDNFGPQLSKVCLYELLYLLSLLPLT